MYIKVIHLKQRQLSIIVKLWATLNHRPSTQNFNSCVKGFWGWLLQYVSAFKVDSYHDYLTKQLWFQFEKLFSSSRVRNVKHFNRQRQHEHCHLAQVEIVIIPEKWKKNHHWIHFVLYNVAGFHLLQLTLKATTSPIILTTYLAPLLTSANTLSLSAVKDVMSICTSVLKIV